MQALQNLNSETFSRGMLPETCITTAKNYRSFVKKLMAETQADADQISRLQAAAKERGGLIASVYTEDWCGDWACNSGYLISLFKEAGIPFRVFHCSEFPDFRARYEDDGVDHIPVVSLWTNEGEEVARWVEAPASMSAKKSGWYEENPDFHQLFRIRDDNPEAAKQFAAMYREFLEQMAEWYKAGDWLETGREIMESLDKEGL